MRIAVVGTGYVGLVSGTCLAETGITVTCVDVDRAKIELLNNGGIPIFEPGLAELVVRNQSDGRLFFTTSLREALKDADAVFIAVGTPPDEDGSADLKYVLGVAREIGEIIDDYIVVVTKSTVPVGTNMKVKATIKEALQKRKVSVPFDVASNPEFLKEGDAVNDFISPDRVVIGVESERAKRVMERLYHVFILNNTPIYFMDIPSAEMTKYAANSMLATRISFMNDIANLCEIVGADVEAVKKGIGSDSRIGKKFLNAGCGYGGSCFPKDVKALIKTGDENGHSLELLKAVERVNERQKEVLFKKVIAHFGPDLKGKRFAMWGLSFKPATDDMREAPSLVLIERLVEAGAVIRAYDPVAMEECERRVGAKIEYASNMYDALSDADALIVVTEWPEFKIPKFTFIEKALKHKIIFDGRNIYSPEQMKEFGYIYYGVGRQK
ncbi:MULTISPECIES: UDP-glucose dehydrogenase family protein [Sanguibacteroides]|uniref:UDP-glucose 6-dehydrogenase n=1 Tax=Sanguibacteroides justesenii TaxID=1547597 RepID=A0A0C3RCU6_9PORP|nr:MULTISPECIES: UDP-glucose/GDP-mannose dehydrogenase family protein [Sanguibacteroides]KIO43906.1 UDP-glucose 6-dehydrogenase [Sanguibacteroides justesenii]KIO46517.1 UDP-glucose 6-dehydrogenase [Sanguibacteroides justesenii]